LFKRTGLNIEQLATAVINKKGELPFLNVTRLSVEIITQPNQRSQRTDDPKTENNCWL